MDKLCQNCQAPLAADAPRGLCPACLMKVAMATGTAAGQDKPGFTPPSIEDLARKFPQLDILELIGRGGMGAVSKARQKELDRIVALKILPPGIGDNAAFAERFAREAKALARLNHPGIITIHDFGRADGLYFFVMEFVDGVNLRQLLESSRVSPREALAIVPQICDALQFAHDQGIVHRDIKPENILLDRRGRVKVADFGLAKLVESNAPLTPSLCPSDGERVAGRPSEGKAPALTDAGKVMGTPAYMAPEQVDHPAEVDHRADIYALGVVFYQMLTGELPGKRIEAPSKKVQIDVRLDEVVLRALEKNPELRYQQVSDVKTIVETIAMTPESAGVPPAEPAIASDLFRPEAMKFARDIRATFTPQGLLLFARKSLLWLACQGLLLFDLFATVPSFVERAGRRRFNFWPFVLLMCSNLGFIVNGVILAIALAQRLWQGKSPALSIQERVMFQWLVLFAVGRLAALNLGEAAKGITRRRVLVVGLTLLGMATLPFVAGPLAGHWLDAASPTAITNAAWVIKRIGVGVLLAVGLFLSVRLVLFSIRLYVRVWREIRVKTEESANSDGLPAVEAWLAIIDGGNYAQSWETAAPYFQGAVSKEEWVGRLARVRRPLGKVLSRKLGPPQFKAGWTRFGASFTFATTFDGMLAAKETVTFARQRPKGEWKAVGYLIKPAGDGKEDPELREQPTSRPLALTLVSVLFILVGVYSIWDMAYNTRYLATKFDPTICYLPVGIGLLRLRPSWRRYALACVWCGYAVLLFILSVVFAKANGLTLLQGSTAVEVFGWKPNAVQATWVGVISFLGHAALLAWMHAVLMRPRVKALFEAQRGKGSGWLEPLVVIWLVLFAFAWIPNKAQTSAAPPQLAAPRGEKPSFGPVIQRELSGSETLSNSFLDLDSGRVLSAPGELVESLRSEGKLNGGSPHLELLRDWMRNSGADLAKRTGEGWSLVQLDGVCRMLTDEAGNRDRPEAFDTMSVERVMRALKAEAEEQSGLTDEKRGSRLNSRGDGFFAFKTREGGMGVLQVLGENNNPRGVKVRYKLVTKPAGTPAEAAATLPLFQFRWVTAEGDTKSPADLLPDPQSRGGAEKLHVLREVVLNSDDVESAGFASYQSDQKELVVFLSLRGGEKFAKATATHIGRRLAIVWNGRVISAPVIRATITGRRVNVNGRFNDAEANQLLDWLNHRAPR